MYCTLLCSIYIYIVNINIIFLNYQSSNGRLPNDFLYLPTNHIDQTDQPVTQPGIAHAVININYNSAKEVNFEKNPTIFIAHF